MSFGLIKKGVLIQKQKEPEKGFVAVPDDAICGQTTADGVVFSNPRPSLVEVKVTKVEEVNVSYASALNAGVNYSGATYQSDAKSISTLTEVLTAISNGWSLPAGFAWIDATNTPHPASIAFLKGLSTALANHKAALFARLQIAKAAIAAGKTKAAVTKIVF